MHRKEMTLKRNFQKLRKSPGVRYKTAGFVADLITKITDKFGEIKATNNSVKLDSNWAHVAVVVETNAKGSYAAIAIQVKNIAYKGK